MDDRMVKELMATVSCAVCGRHYDSDNISILYHQNELWFISVSCGSCHTKGLVAALIKESGETQFVTDLTEAELARFIETPPISGDDVLEFHDFLKSFDGDFASLFGKKDSQS